MLKLASRHIGHGHGHGQLELRLDACSSGKMVEMLFGQILVFVLDMRGSHSE